MPETNCENCQHKVLTGKLEDKYDKLEERVGKMERRLDVSDEKFKQVFQKLDEIIGILKTNQSRLPNLVWGAMGTVLGGIAIWIVMSAIQK